MMKNVAETTRLDFNVLWNMGVVEFLNYVRFNISYGKWYEAETKKYMNNRK